MEYKLSEQELKDLMHRTWLKAKRFYTGKEDEYFYDYFKSEKKQLPIHVVVCRKACSMVQGKVNCFSKLASTLINSR